jgi:hypothetical protein
MTRDGAGMNGDGLRPARGAYNPDYDPSAWIAEAKRRIADERKAAEAATRARLRKHGIRLSHFDQPEPDQEIA